MTSLRYRLASSARWASLIWSEERGHSQEFLLACAAALPIPGVREHPKAIDVPVTAFMLPEVHRLFAAARVDIPTPRSDVDPGKLWSPQQKPFDHQVEGARFIVNAGSALVCDEMGVGKTRTAIQAAQSARLSWGGPAVIVAPKFTRATWLRELLATGAIENPTQFCALESRDLGDSSFRAGCHYYFVHYDVVSTWWTRLQSSERPTVTIVDEAHWIKNGRAKRSKGADLATAGTHMRILLTGTPLVNSPADLWYPLQCVTGASTWGSPLDFRVRYNGAIRTSYGHKDLGPTYTNELRLRMAPWYLRRTTEQAGLQLPALTRTAVECEMSRALAREHSGILGKVDPAAIVTAILENRMGTETLKMLNRLRQITSAAKLGDTAEYVSNILDQGDAAVVFVWQPETARKLRARMAEPDAHAEITGDQDQGTRDALIAAFQAGAGPAALFCTYGTVREGVTLHRARHVVHHDLDWTAVTIQQAEKRIHRIGQNRACTATWMVARNSMDTIFAEVLRAKLDAAQQVFGDANPFEASLDTISVGMSLQDKMRAAIEEWRAW
jgi:SWI/SNF-related matrix-associated actin-dependent regulator 1 of chromatin subfamily A